MSEELGKIQRPEAAAFKNKRKLYIVPLLYRWAEADKEYTELFDRYWQDVGSQLKHMAERIGEVKHVYHEGIDESGKAALGSLERYNPASFGLSKALIQSGAALTPIEDRDLVAESLDWERFVMFGFASVKVGKLVTEEYRKAMKSRYDHIIKQIDKSLKPDEAGVLFIREGHPIQFPREIEVFSVSPPVLDEIHRYIRNKPEEAAETDNEEEHECEHCHCGEEPSEASAAPEKK